MVLYIGMSGFHIYRLMFPLASIDISQFPDESQWVKPLWSHRDHEELNLRVYLSSKPTFNRAFIDAEFPSEESKTNDAVAVLLWDEKLESAAFSKSFLLTNLHNCDRDNNNNNNNSCQNDASYTAAVSWLDHAEKVAGEMSDGGVLSAMSAAGHGIESTSFLLTIYHSLSAQIRKLLVNLSILPDTSNSEEPTLDGVLDRKIVHLSPQSHIWSTLQSNSTLYVHALVVRNEGRQLAWPPTSHEQAMSSIQEASRSHSMLMGQVNMTKFEAPHHIGKPKRILYHDIVYLVKKYILRSTTDEQRPPWDMAYSKPKDYANYERVQELKAQGRGYPYWKPEVAIKLVNEEDLYPLQLAGMSGMPIVNVTLIRGWNKMHSTGIAFLPVMHVDEIGLTSEKYIPINTTLTSLPLRVSFDRSDIKHKVSGTTATAGGMSPARWRLLSHLSEALEKQKELGFEQSDIDDVRRLIADTNVTLLAVTILFSALHMLFEFLTFKSEVSFWKNNKDLTGLSVRSLFLDMIGQTVILLFLIEKDSSLLMTVPSAIGCLIALWKCRRASGLQFIRVQDPENIVWWNKIPALFGYELRATRLELKETPSSDIGKKRNGETTKVDLTRVTIEADRIATRTLGSVLLPLVVGYTLYSLVREEHTGWYSWLVTSASSAVYALGFVLMTPQLFLNWKLKSVAHLPWRVLVYKSLNTFIDDLFSFIIRMPTMARISCFRDDVVFFIYLYQRWLYPVDKSRPVEGGGELNETTTETTTTTKEKKNQ